MRPVRGEICIQISIFIIKQLIDIQPSQIFFFRKLMNGIIHLVNIFIIENSITLRFFFCHMKVGLQHQTGIRLKLLDLIHQLSVFPDGCLPVITQFIDPQHHQNEFILPLA